MRDLFFRCFRWLDPLVWKLQALGPSKTQIGFLLYIPATLYTAGATWALLLCILIEVLAHHRALWWAWAEGDKPIRGALPIEWVHLAVYAAILFGGALLIIPGTGLLLLVVFALVQAGPPASPTPSSEMFSALFITPLLMPAGGIFLVWPIRALGAMVLCCTPRPPSERFSLTRWLQERRERATPPILLEIRR